jgi:small subunit ribosomal protein S20
MAKIKSQIKRIKTNEKRRIANKSKKSEIKTAVKQFERAVTEKDLETARAQLTRVVRLLDKAASKKILHKNKAATKKSKLYRKLNSLTASGD